MNRWILAFLFAFSWGCQPALNRARQDYELALKEHGSIRREHSRLNEACVLKLTEPTPGNTRGKAAMALTRYWTTQGLYLVEDRKIEDDLHAAGPQILDAGVDDLAPVNLAAGLKVRVAALRLKMKEAMNACR